MHDFILQKILNKLSSFLRVYEWIKYALTETKAGIHSRFLFQDRLKLRFNMLIRLLLAYNILKLYLIRS